MDNNEIRELAKLLAKELQKSQDANYVAELAPKWESGSIFFMPNNSELKEHEMSIDKLFNKIIMIRDNLRVLEQQINANDTLSKGEKIKFQNYISKCYGSLTSFNFLFYNEEDKFSSKLDKSE